MNDTLVCPLCNYEAEIISNNLAKCSECNEIFEIQDELTPKQIRTKPRRREEENLEDGR